MSGGPAIQLKEAWTVNQLPVVISHMTTAGVIHTWPHLRGVKAPGRANDVVELLIGTYVPTAYVPIELRSGNISESYAVKTALGWVVRGPRKVSLSPRNGVLRGAVIGCTSVRIQTSQDRRHTCDADFSEIPVTATITSKEDKHALQTMELTLPIQKRHYPLALPRRNEKATSPKNHPKTEQRLKEFNGPLEKDTTKCVTMISDNIYQGHMVLTEEYPQVMGAYAQVTHADGQITLKKTLKSTKKLWR